jgi:hypothetical protein
MIDCKTLKDLIEYIRRDDYADDAIVVARLELLRPLAQQADNENPFEPPLESEIDVWLRYINQGGRAEDANVEYDEDATICCPCCERGIHRDGAEVTSIADHGKCVACHKEWQTGEFGFGVCVNCNGCLEEDGFCPACDPNPESPTEGFLVGDVYYACYGYTTDEDADLDCPANRKPYVVHMGAPVKTDADGEPYLSDTWPDSGPFNTYQEAWNKAQEIAEREYRESWDD